MRRYRGHGCKEDHPLHKARIRLHMSQSNDNPKMCPGSDYHWVNGGSTNSSRIVGAHSGDERLAGMFSDESRELWVLIGSCTENLHLMRYG